MKVVPQTLMRLVQAGASVEADTMFPDRMVEIATAASQHRLKPRVTFRVKGTFNPDVLVAVAEAGRGCVVFIFPTEP